MLRLTAVSTVLASLLATTAAAEDLVGRASVIDGDTIEIHGTRIRLWGIDAPESDQLCRGEDSENIGAVRRQPPPTPPCSTRYPGRSPVPQPDRTSTVARWLSARWGPRTPISGSGSLRMGMPWTGRSIPRASTMTPAQSREGWARHLGRQFRRAMALPRQHARQRPAGRLLGPSAAALNSVARFVRPKS